MKTVLYPIIMIERTNFIIRVFPNFNRVSGPNIILMAGVSKDQVTATIVLLRSSAKLLLSLWLLHSFKLELESFLLHGGS